MSRASQCGDKPIGCRRTQEDDLPWEERTSMMQPRNERSIYTELKASLEQAVEISKVYGTPPLADLPAISKKLALFEEEFKETMEQGFRDMPRFGAPLEPWEQCPDVWKTKAAFFQWMRGQMRRAWSRHPVKVAYMSQHRKRVPLGRVTVKNPQGLVWGCQCEHCKQEFKQTECEVDHIDAAGSFKGWEDFEAWMHKLMHINFDSIRIVCKECHRIISYAERMGMTFEEAKLEKQAIAFSKLKVSTQNGILVQCMREGFVHVATNAKDRRAAFKRYLQEKL